MYIYIYIFIYIHMYIYKYPLQVAPAGSRLPCCGLNGCPLSRSCPLPSPIGTVSPDQLAP